MKTGMKFIYGSVMFVIGLMLILAYEKYDNIKVKYSMNLKCIQGELYEEVRTNMYVKSHLECFEQKTLVP
jgi:hypothetical protein